MTAYITLYKTLYIARKHIMTMTHVMEHVYWENESRGILLYFKKFNSIEKKLILQRSSQSNNSDEVIWC